jgi:AICAR transformylase/IMP cyclohydrolase PurH
MALRRPDVFTGARYGYINLRDAKNPYWQLIKEKSNEEVVTIKHPNCSQIDFNKKDYMMKTLSSMGLKMESTMSNLNTNISVKIF